MKAVDDVEIKGLTAVFVDKLAEKPVVELKEVLGESRAAAATTAAAHAALMFAGKIPSQDAYSIAADGSMAAQAMTEAVKDAGIKPENIDYINAHGTSTKLNDKGETNAIKKAFGEHAYKLAVSSTKSMKGHMLGASGAVEAIISALAVKNDIIPPTINYQVPDDDCDLDIVPNKARESRVDYAMSNSLGFGGHNASIVLRKVV